MGTRGHERLFIFATPNDNGARVSLAGTFPWVTRKVQTVIGRERVKSMQIENQSMIARSVQSYSVKRNGMGGLGYLWINCTAFEHQPCPTTALLQLLCLILWHQGSAAWNRSDSPEGRAFSELKWVALRTPWQINARAYNCNMNVRRAKM